MTDVIDRANELAQHEIETILANRGKVFKGESLINCQECDEPIPERRRKVLLGCKLCFDCQALKEQKAKQIIGMSIPNMI